MNALQCHQPRAPRRSSLRSTTAPRSESKNRENLSLKFKRQTRVYLIPTLDELTDEEYNSMYWSPADEERSKEDIHKTLLQARRILSNLPPPKTQEEVTVRGIEHLVSAERLAQRRKVKQRVLVAVLDEQDRQLDQYEAGQTTIPINNPERLASVSQHFSRANVVYASFKALQDAKEAANF